MPTQTRSKDLPRPISIWKSIGPSFILLGLAMGSGELILWPYLAAHWGLGLLWGALLGISFQFVLNTEVMRYTLAWGESVFVGFRKISILLPVWFILSTFIPWSLPGLSSASAEILHTLVPQLSSKFLSIGLLLLTGLLISSGSSVYKTMETIQKTTIMVGLPFVFILAMLVTNQQDWIEAAWGIIGRGDGWWFFPQGVGITAFLGAFAYSGAGGNLNLAQSYYIKEKGFGMGAHSPKLASLFSHKTQTIELFGQRFTDTKINFVRWQGWWRLVTREHFLIFWLLGFTSIVTLAVLAKSTVLDSNVAEGIDFLFVEAKTIGNILHPIFGVGFLITAALLLFTTQVGILESSSRIISENVLLLLHKKEHKLNLSRAFYYALWGQIGLGILIYALGVQEPRFLITLGATLNALAMMAAFVLVGYLNKKTMLPNYQTPLSRKMVMLVAICFFGYFLALSVKDLKF
jgi:hypothetical protein